MIWKTTRIIICLFTVFSGFTSYAQSEVHTDYSWVPNGTVTNVEHSNGYTLLTGYFNNVAQYVGSATLIDNATNKIIDFPIISGIVYASVSDTKGGWYIGGAFNMVDTVKVSNLVHINSDKTVDRTWKPNPNYDVKALEIQDKILYVGGQFTTINGQTRNYVAGFDLLSGNLNDWNPDADSYVYDLEIAGDVIYLAGNFTKVGGEDRTCAASVTGAKGSVTSWAPVIYIDGLPFARAIKYDPTSNTVFICGYFDYVGDKPRYRVAQVNTTDNGSVTDWVVNFDGSADVKNIVLSGNTLFLGGDFSSVEGLLRNKVAAISTTGTGDVLDWDAQLDGSTYFDNFCLVENTLYISGYNVGIDGSYVGGFNISDAQRVVSPKLDGVVNTAFLTSNNLFLAGSFTTVNPIYVDNLVILDEATGKPWIYMDSLNLNKGGNIYTIAVKDKTLYIGGDFTSVNDKPRTCLAEINLSTGELLPFKPSVSTLQVETYPDVRTMEIKDDLLYFGGVFDHIDKNIRNCMATIDLNTDEVGSWDPQYLGVESSVYRINSLDVVDDKVYFAGYFYSYINNENRSHIAAVDATSGKVLPFAPQCSGEVLKICVAEKAAYVLAAYDGAFSDGIGGGFVNDNVAAIDLATDSLTDWNPQFDNSYSVNDIALTSTDLYVGGDFSAILIDKSTQPYKPGLASFSLKTDSLNSWTPDLTHYGESSLPSVNSLATSTDKILVGGPFNALGNHYHGYYAEYQYCGPQAVALTLDGSTLSTNEAYDSYQWYKNGELIEGATGQSLEIPTYEFGTYNVALSKYGCTNLSYDYNYLITGDEKNSKDLIKVFPNPAQNEFFVEVPEQGTLTLTDMMGRGVRNSVLIKEQSNRIDTQDLISGAYILSIHAGNNTYHYKLLKTH